MTSALDDSTGNMPVPPGAEMHKLRWYQFSLWQLLVAVVVLSILVSCCVRWYKSSEAWELDRQIRATVASLEKECPPTMTRRQWESAVGWTRTLLANSLLRFEGEVDEIRRFQSELHARTEQEVDMRTILWIWEQVGHLTPTGKEYQQKYERQMLEEIEAVGPNGDGYVPLTAGGTP